MADRRSNDRGFNEIATRATVWVLVCGGLFFGVLITSLVLAPDNPWPIIGIFGVVWIVAIFWSQVANRRRQELSEQASPICCPNCRFLTATPSGFCPRCNATIPSQRCRKCGYDLRGNTTGACSECGMQWDAPPGTFRCTWSDCNQPNPTGTLTCEYCGKEIAPSDPLPEEERRFVRRFLLYDWLFRILILVILFVVASLITLLGR